MTGARTPRTRLAKVCALLNEQGARYVLIGASAMQLWGTTRATRDIDVLIEATEENVRRILDALGGMGFGYARDFSVEEVLKKPITIFGDAPRVDLFTVAWTVHYPEAAEAAESFDLEGVPILTMSIDHLIASKRTGDLQDAADIAVLETIKRLRNA